MLSALPLATGGVEEGLHNPLQGVTFRIERGVGVQISYGLKDVAGDSLNRNVAILSATLSESGMKGMTHLIHSTPHDPMDMKMSVPGKTW
jgi:hypothetical protein